MVELWCIVKSSMCYSQAFLGYKIAIPVEKSVELMMRESQSQMFNSVNKFEHLAQFWSSHDNSNVLKIFINRKTSV